MKENVSKSFRQFLALILCAAMLLPMLPVSVFAEETEGQDVVVNGTEPETEAVVTAETSEDPLAVIYAASDFQAENSDKTKDSVENGRKNMNAIIAKMKAAGYSNVTGALFCGDYTANFNTWGSSSGAGNKTNSLAASNAGANAVEEVLNTAWGLTDAEVVYVQGNHDYAGFDNMDTSGANDTEHYGVFVIHEDDFWWRQGLTTSGNSGNAQTAAQNTAAALETYLKAKVAEKYDQPIFVTSHVPLHFGYRTTEAKGGDNIYAKYIFDVLNKYGADLDIIFLFGHNHSSTYDDYLGGGAVYLPVGDKIWIPNEGSMTNWTEYTLTFTYMNAGYVGYYGGDCGIGLSSTIFEIYEDKVVIARYTADGLADLKVAGVKASTDTWTGAAKNGTVYSSTQSIDPMKEFHVDLDYGTLASGKVMVGNSGTLTIKGLYNTSYNVAWSSSDDNVASVAPAADTMSATLTANAEGTAKITAVVTEMDSSALVATTAVGGQVVLEYNVEVVDTAEGAAVVLVPAGEYSWFKKVDSLTLNKTYAFIDIENDGYLIGQQEALHYNASTDAKENDAVSSDANKVYELNAAGVNVFQLPVGGELLTLSDITNENCWWVADAAKEAGNVGGTIRTYADRTYNYLFAIEGDGDFLDRDKDQDRIAVGNEKEASSTGGAHWYYDTTYGLVTNHKTDGFQFALYYSQANTDFSAYRINYDGTNRSIQDTNYAQMANEAPNSRVYAFEQTTFTVDQDITAYVNDLTGYVNKDVGYTDDANKRLGGAQTGDKIVINNGTRTDEINVTIDMLSGTFDVTKAGTYAGLTVTYMGVDITTEYILVVNDSTTILKNDAAREHMDTIYRLVTEWYPGRQYLIVDTDKEGIGHAMGVGSDKVRAYNVLIQNLPVGNGGMYIDASRYSASADATTANLVGRGIKDQGNINEFFKETPTLTTYQKAIRLAWTVTNRYFPTDKDPEFNDTRRHDWYYLVSQMQAADAAEHLRLLSIAKDAEDTQLTLLDQAYTNSKPSNATETVTHWWWDQWRYDNTASTYGIGVHLSSSKSSPQVAHGQLFYNAQNIIGNTADGAATKNFQTEEKTNTTNAGETYEHTFDLSPYRRTWIYERVTDIDTVSARISDKSAHMTVRIEGQSESTHGATFTGDYVLVDTTHSKGHVTTEQVPITVSMLSGNYDLTKEGTYPNLTVTYQGKTICTDYTLVVTKFVPNDYPEFPNEGAVRIDKQLDTSKYAYLDTGVASIDLLVSGIPAQTGVDLVVILDASSSMQNCPHGASSSCTTCGEITYNKTRMGLMEATLESMLKQLKAPMANGYTPDVDVAIATFNGYTPINTDYEFWYSGTKNDGTGDSLSHNSGQQTEEERPDASEILLPFTNISNVDPSFKNQDTTGRDIAYNKGTNYDRGIEIAYQLLKEKQELNALNGVNRDAVVVFMSDGAPYQYNFFHGDPNVIDWQYFLNASLTASSTGVTKQSAAVQSAFKKYAYHIANGGTENKHWMTEAIKGDPNQRYTIIDRHAMTADHMTEVNGLGATMYTIGFGLAKDHVVTVDIMDKILTGMATDADHYIAVADGEALEAAFSHIAGEVRSAGNAVFKDQMGDRFDLVTSNILTLVDDKGETKYVDLTTTPPEIVVKTYELYKRSEIGKTLTFTVNGVEQQVKVTETMVGTRKPLEPTILEKITFDDHGTAAYSSVKGEGVNILNGDIIEAATFFYNTNTSETRNITVNGKTIPLEHDTFYWNIGNIPEQDLVLSYSIYLNGSMEGLREAGSYDTNKYAELTYTNYLGNDCTLEVGTPKLPWHSGSVGYAFYLVDKYGNPIINQSTGQIGSFEQSVKMTEPVYKTFFLNSVGAEVLAETIEATNVLPEGYQLFDAGAVYEVMLQSNGIGYYDVAVGREVKTTYVQGIESTAIKPEGKTDTMFFQTASTIVWFAVTAETKAVPDTVVIDYGLPVEIDVLANDVMMGTFGTLKYVSDTSTFPLEDGQKLWEELQKKSIITEPTFYTEYAEGAYGILTIPKNAEGNSTGKVLYTMNKTNGMQMDKEETFIYAVEYTGSVGAQGYYYSSVTVIPATTIYYEDSFVTYTAWNVSDDELNEDTDNQWKTEAATDRNQAQDRPGGFSLPAVDADNIYGYDGAYADMATYSMGSAAKFVANDQVYGEAQFTFWGTGFDVVSLTSNLSGTITVDVYDAEAFAEEQYNAGCTSFLVDTYYGYKYVLREVTYEWDVTADYPEGHWAKISAEEPAADAEAEDTPFPADPKDGDQFTRVEYVWIVDEDASDSLYQVPVMKVSGLEYKKYTVVITVYYMEAFDHQNDGQYEFYLDAIRIYDPANDGEGNDVIEDAYVADGEGWPEYFELRNLIISRKTYDSLGDGTVSGIVFIDNTLDNDTGYSIADYTNYGPNNELYLAPGQSVAFNLDVTGDVAGIHLAMKSVGQKTAKVKVFDAADRAQTNHTPDSIATATDLYYDITSLNKKIVVITNTGTAEDGILSITNIKVTYKSAHTDAIDNSFFTTTQEATEAAVAALLLMKQPPAEPEEPIPETTEPVPETTVPEEPAEPVFDPRRFDVYLSDSEVKVGSEVIVTVYTGRDVEYITINGVKVTEYSGGRYSNTRSWMVRIEAEDVGEMEIAVVGYNSESLASDPVVKTVTVTEQYTGIIDIVRDLIIGFFGRFR